MAKFNKVTGVQRWILGRDLVILHVEQAGGSRANPDEAGMGPAEASEPAAVQTTRWRQSPEMLGQLFLNHTVCGQSPARFSTSQSMILHQLHSASRPPASSAELLHASALLEAFGQPTDSGTEKPPSAARSTQAGKAGSGLAGRQASSAGRPTAPRGDATEQAKAPSSILATLAEVEFRKSFGLEGETSFPLPKIEGGAVLVAGPRRSEPCHSIQSISPSSSGEGQLEE
ncbi:hypothetical protein CPLU01_01979 [Colletotrichum plurivorum]|uniref:Uncharacterized protein n=1 Tax=Colletotrichum plurivorum TaxID=2175906 RepID=A0A8H6KXU8_9PEZI|nr:hypothetical protein CPLU01_01979 [Colletotrichum plurivorum]